MKLSEIIKKNISSMNNVKVDVNYRYGYITISENGDEIFLQGDDYHYFMQELEKIEDVDGASHEEKLLFIAEPYTVVWSN